MVISRSGITWLNLEQALRITGIHASENVLSAEDIIEIYRDSWEQSLSPLPPEKWTIRHMFLEYLPKVNENKVIMTPYWCIVPEISVFSSDGEYIGDHVFYADRYNAVTGDNLSYVP